MKHSGIHSTKYNLGHGYKSIIIVIILSIKLEVCTSDENKNCYNFERVKKKPQDESFGYKALPRIWMSASLSSGTPHPAVRDTAR